MITPADIDLSCAIKVISRAQKFIVPVPCDSYSDLLIYPDGAPKAGSPIIDHKGRPVGERGLVFFNAVDNCHQAVASDGCSVIIVNQVSREDAEAIESFIGRLGESIDSLSMAAVKAVLSFVATALRLNDIYNSTDSYVRERMVAVAQPRSCQGRAAGWMCRRATDILDATFITGHGEFLGPAATAQVIPPEGAVILRDNDELRMIAVDVMLSTYLHSDGRPLTPGDFLGLSRHAHVVRTGSPR